MTEKVHFFGHPGNGVKTVKIAITFLLAILSQFLLSADTLEGRVVRVSDGDTITLLDAANTQSKIRLNGIDAPEKSQAFGEASRQNLARYIAGKSVRVEWKKRDRYGRILGTIFIDDLDVNLQQLKDGYAWHYKQFDSNPAYAAAEAAAKEKRLGLWAGKDPVNPSDWRKNKRGR